MSLPLSPSSLVVFNTRMSTVKFVFILRELWLISILKRRRRLINTLIKPLKVFNLLLL